MTACKFQALLLQTETVTISHSFQVWAGLWKWQLELHRMSLGAGWSSAPTSTNCSEACKAEPAGHRHCRAVASTVKVIIGKVMLWDPWGLRLRAGSYCHSRALPEGLAQRRKALGVLGGHSPRAVRDSRAGGRIWTGAKERQLRFECQDEQKTTNTSGHGMVFCTKSHSLPRQGRSAFILGEQSSRPGLKES